MKRAYKYRIYPTDEQKEFFAKCFGGNRWFWNYALDKKKKVYEETKKTISAQYDITKDLPILKKTEETSWLKEVESTSLFNTAINLDNAYKNFFRRGGFPKYKTAQYDNSFTINIKKTQKDVVLWKKSLIKVRKCGLVKISLHKKFYGEIKSLTISKKSYDFYQVSILVDDNFIVPKTKKPTIEGTVGIDMGIKQDGNAILHNGERFGCSDVKKYEERVKKLQRQLAKKQWIKTGETKFSRKYNKDVEVKRPSKNYLKLKDKIAKLQDKIARIRAYNTHQISSYVAKNDEWDTVCVENLNNKGMSRNHHVAKSNANSNKYELRRQLEYKSKWNGKNFVVIDRFFPSSQTCSVCGYKNPKTKNLNVRKWVCPHCGTEHDRDVNAAINIKNEGYAQITQNKSK